MKRWLGFLCLVLAILSLVLNGRELGRMVEGALRAASQWHGRAYRGNGAHTDAYREIVERFVPPGASVYYCIDSSDGVLQPVERSIQLTLSWALCPRPVRFGRAENLADETAVVVSRFRRVAFPGYRCVARDERVALWLKEGVPPVDRGVRPREVSPLRESVGTGVVSSLVLLFGWLVSRRERRRWYFLGAAVVLAAAGTLALTHTLVAPTGLGVYGGKARLIWMCGGVPPGFFTDAARSTLQPAYPPGFALLTLVAYALSGGCGEWLVQLVAVSSAAALAGYLCTVANAHSTRCLALAAVLSPLSLRLAALDYAEPLVAILILAGWSRVRERGGAAFGWFLFGLSGLAKNEGLVLLFSCWLVLRVIEGRRTASARGLLVGGALPLAWQIGCRLAGGTLYHFAAPWSPDLSRLLEAGAAFLRLAFLRPWEYAFAWPLAVLLALFALRRRVAVRDGAVFGGLCAALGSAFVSCAVFVYILSLSLAPNFSWHLGTALPRLVWMPTVLLLAEILRFPNERTFPR